MGSAVQSDDRTFNGDFSKEGVAKLRDRVKDKLKEFMGDYSDDTLVEYVIVLLKNGRQKEEAQNELNVFLGDDSKSFINWLWDHLAESLDEYLSPRDPHFEQTTKRTISQNEDKESGKSRLSHRSRKWRDLPNDAAKVLPLISSEIHKIDYEEKKDIKGRRDRRSPSPQSHTHRKRSRTDDQQHEQREAKLDVSHRLLQFAVRDALATSKPTNYLKEPSLKRLRSVVSTSNEDSSAPNPPPRLRSVARVVNPMATVMKAVAEAAEDVKKTKSGRSVFDRISHTTSVSETIDQHGELREAALEDEECDEFSEDREQILPQYNHGLDYNGAFDENMSTFDNGLQPNAMPIHSRVNIGVNASQKNFSNRYRIGNPTSVQHNVTAQNHLHEAAAMVKSVSSSRIIDLGKQLKHREKNGVVDVGSQGALKDGKIHTSEAITQSSNKNKSISGVRNGNVKPAIGVLQEAPRTLISAPGTQTTGRPFEDAAARTIFVTNVHFGATKDSLSRHFNKFGDVLKVVIVTDPTTGQLTGSAYIEFMRKEAADNALSLDGTSFMSRILKIVKGSSSQQEAAHTMTWSRATPGPTYAPARFHRAPYGRGIPGAFRGRPPIRPGARSMQWKRDSAAPSDTGSGAGNGGLAPTARSITYVRSDQKAGASDATAA